MFPGYPAMSSFQLLLLEGTGATGAVWMHPMSFLYPVQFDAGRKSVKTFTSMHPKGREKGCDVFKGGTWALIDVLVRDHHEAKKEKRRRWFFLGPRQHGIPVLLLLFRAS